MAETQSANSKKGEIEFRKKLVQQQVEGIPALKDEFSDLEIETILRERMEKTFRQISELERQGYALSPYIEIGAERCQRSLVMENDLNISGAAVDISFDMLKSCEYYGGRFNKSKIPRRICCDAYNLPFVSDSIPFVFCYETLHHFPDPSPVVREIHRVLSPGGVFFFAEEPYKQALRFRLYKRGKAYSAESLKRNGLKRLLDHFFSEVSYNEIEYGIVENHDISIEEWRTILEVFQKKEVRLKSLKGLNSGLFEPGSSLRFNLARLCGGNLTGTCMKAGSREPSVKTIEEAMACPVCGSAGKDIALLSGERRLHCMNCDSSFPEVDNILHMFRPEQLKELYPDVS
jgi:SAM-dependent methyltransferase